MQKEKEPIDMWQYETMCKEEGKQLIAGVDEAGRGPLAGPVYAAAVILPFGIEIKGLNDSKKLTEKKRNELFDIITKEAVAYAVCACDHKEIETINILQATLKTMAAAVAGLGVCPDIVLIDGNKCPECEVETRYIIGGDGLSNSIAAASILAKVSRDRHMVEMGEKYPEYGFAKHKGYGTQAHIDVLQKIGPCEIHRKSFLGKILKDTDYL